VYFARHSLVATDYDSVDGQWATTGPSWYLLAQAMWDGAAFDYERSMADYCVAAFGRPAAAEGCAYWQVGRLAQPHNEFMTKPLVVPELTDTCGYGLANDKCSTSSHSTAHGPASTREPGNSKQAVPCEFRHLCMYLILFAGAGTACSI